MSYQPPPFNYTQPPYGYVPLPLVSTQPLEIAPLLQRTRGGAPISWLVSDHPSTATTNMLLPHGRAWQNEQATYPPVSSLTIWSGPTGDRPIVVRGNPYVTVWDVLLTVHHAIRDVAQERFQPVHQQHLLSFPPSYHHPIPHPTPSEQEVRQWVLNHLNGRYTWRGLKPYEPESWVLHIR
ncbi:hypothetical protein P691DRAFT_727352, partial [Macrolepiota fuliginosa MF-IS2]